GLAFTVRPEEYDRLFPRNRLVGSCYSFCTHAIMTGVSSWIDRNPYIKRMTYFFEEGHRSQSEANSIMQMMFRHEQVRYSHRYSAHAFVEKTALPAIQAADLLAWQWYTDKRHEMEGKPMRKDCASLLQHPHEVMHLDPEKM